MRCVRSVAALALLALAPVVARADSYQATLFVSDLPDIAQIMDPLLVNPWGVSFGATGPFWVSNAGTGTATLYSGDVNGSPFMKNSLEVSIPGGDPTGQVFNGTGDFQGAVFIFAGINGTINAWSSGTVAELKASVDGASYRGITIVTSSSGANFLLAANPAGGTLDVFDGGYNLVDAGGAFTDPNLDPDLVPFNVLNLNGVVYVTYKSSSNPDVGGAVDAYDTDGNLIMQVAQGGTLNAPWGVAVAPDNFGEFSNALLVGGFGDGRISAFDPSSGAFLGLLLDDDGNPWVFDDLWMLIFGNGGSGGDTSTLYFTAGINDQQNGLFGSLKPSGE